MAQQDPNDPMRAMVEAQAQYLGSDISDVLDSITTQAAKEQDEMLSEVVAGLNAASAGSQLAAGPERAVAAASGAAKESWYAGSVSISGLIRGMLDASVYFGDHGNFRYSGSMWSGPAAIAGGGGGAWTVVPSDGQAMDFAYWAGAFTGGGCNVFWNINKVVVGAMAIAVGGIAASGGSGSGTWRKGN
jgi:hypothetical protein